MHHVFFTPLTEARPRWREAFPDLHLKSWADTHQAHTFSAQVLWLHLPSNQDFAEHVTPLRTQSPHTPLVILCDQPDPAIGIALLGIGAAGFCNANAAPLLLQQISTVVRHGGLWIGETVMQQLIRGVVGIAGTEAVTDRVPALSTQLTEREYAVAKQVSTGASNREIAATMHISERTVKAHLTAIFSKTGARDRLQLSLLINR